MEHYTAVVDEEIEEPYMLAVEEMLVEEMSDVRWAALNVLDWLLSLLLQSKRCHKTSKILHRQVVEFHTESRTFFSEGESYCFTKKDTVKTAGRYRWN